MTSEQFCYWLQGFFEITDCKEITKEQTTIIKDHLNLIFDKQTPNRTLLDNFNDLIKKDEKKKVLPQQHPRKIC